MKLEVIAGKPMRDEQIRARWYRLLNDQVYYDGTHYWGVPTGVEGDGVSMPWFLPERGSWESAAWPHDMGYRHEGLHRWDPVLCEWQWVKCTRSFIDEFYRAAAIAHGTNRAWSATMWGTLRAWPGTWLIWHRHRRRNLPYLGPAPSFCPVGGAA